MVSSTHVLLVLFKMRLVSMSAKPAPSTATAVLARIFPMHALAIRAGILRGGGGVK